MRILPLVVLVLSLAGCERPREEDCQAAIDNMHRILGNKQPEPAETAAEVRRCRAYSKNKTVACFKAAKNQAELDACGSMAAGK
jgi:hypothetical protein